ncbi:MAG: hypothetical protein A2464_07370 [Deltaproteobacteria bacterium RIFOXYC2_FULL_48_10]|nr:MAG: hypothetical protein A2464_07370 [Deltaproteobacteria bacterium RIFOXYC2_FULL_48_10]
MSHLARIELEVTDLESLCRACRHIGLTLVKGKTTFKWYNGDSPCDHAIEVPGAGYEIGLVFNNGKYELQTDFWDKGIEAAIGKNGGLLKQRYAVERTRTEARRKGYRVIEQQTDNGIRLHVRM